MDLFDLNREPLSLAEAICDCNGCAMIQKLVVGLKSTRTVARETVNRHNQISPQTVNNRIQKPERGQSVPEMQYKEKEGKKKEPRSDRQRKKE
jgi:hypothetical protein